VLDASSSSNGVEFDELVEGLRVRYAHRLAFLDEIKWL
jgi:hypothetical protein